MTAIDLLLQNARVATMTEAAGCSVIDNAAIAVADGRVVWLGLADEAPEDARVTNRCQASNADTAAARVFIGLGYSPDRHEIEM